jgi:hypothetical protein
MRPPYEAPTITTCRFSVTIVSLSQDVGNFDLRFVLDWFGLGLLLAWLTPCPGSLCVSNLMTELNLV